MCVVRERDISCSAHTGIVTREQTSDSQMAKQVTVGVGSLVDDSNGAQRRFILSTVQEKDFLYTKLLDSICEGKSSTEIITIPERIADVIFYKK
jgi:hypothetical protein